MRYRVVDVQHVELVVLHDFRHFRGQCECRMEGTGIRIWGHVDFVIANTREPPNPVGWVGSS